MNRSVSYWAWPALVAFVSAFSLLTSCRDDGDSATPEVHIPFRIDGSLDLVRDGRPYLTMNIEIAADDSSRMRGMMQRRAFPANSGMLFLFPFEDIQSFWMANTPLSLDIIFADADSQIVTIRRYTRPLSPENVTSDKPAMFVLEVPAGFADSHGLVESDRLRWTEKGGDVSAGGA